MNNDIQTLFQSHFDYSTYSRQIVHEVFGCNDIEQTLDDPIDISAAGDRSYYIGQMEDSDHQLLGFFYTRTAEGSDVRRKRVGWHKLINPYLKYHVDAAVAVFDDGQHWRLSYICDQKESLTAAKRFSYVMGDAAGQYKTPVARLGRVAACRGRFALSDIFEAFSVEALSNQFFDEYRNYYADIVEDLTGKRMVKVGNNWVEKVIHAPLQSVYDQLDGVEDADKMVRDYVKKLLGRIVFLHFLQKKGWLNGTPAFLSNLFFMQPLDRKADFLEKVLEPLFFGIFNTERASREKLFAEQGWDMELLGQWRNLPYLNGGLFERDEVDKVHVKLPEQRFKKLFEFLASYNFTVDENDPDDAEVGVDPEMLGKIFESLLEDNKSKGAFYTPKEIVRYMCKESLIAYLVSKVENSDGLQDASEKQDAQSANNPTQESGKLSQCGDGGDDAKCVSETRDLKAIVRQFVEQHELPAELEPYRETLDAALLNVKICDPAIGSGAFPMGLLNELWRCREALQDNSESCDFNNTEKKVQWTFDSEAENIAKRSAVTSTESPLCAGGTRPQSRVDLKKEIIENNIYGVDIERGAIDIARLRFWLSIVVDAEEPEPLPNFDYKFMQGNSLIESFEGHDLSHIMDKRPTGRSWKQAYQRKIDGKEEVQISMDFCSDDTCQNLRIWLKKYFSLTDHKEKAHYRELINGSVKSYIKQQGIGPTAEAKLDKLDPSANQDFFLWHTWFKDIFDNGGFDIVIGNPPYFKYEGKNKNEIDSIRQTQYLEIAFGGKLNAYKLFLALSINKICKSNGIISLIFQNSFIADKQASILRREVINKHQIITIDSFPERDSKKKRVFENVIMSVCILLMQKSVTGKRFNVNFWNDKYKSSGTNIIFSADEIKRIDNEDYCIPRIEQSTIPLVIKLRQMKKFPLKCYEGELNMTFHKSFFNSNPNNPTILKGAAIQRYYITYRMSQGEMEYLDEKRFLSENSSEKAFHHEQERLAMQGMTGANDKIRLVMTIVPRGVYLANSCNYIIPTKELPAKYLLGLMNSHLMNWYFRCFSTNSNVNGYEVENFPMPNDNTNIRREITELVDTILRLKANNASVDTSEQEQQIDKLVYQLYNLTPEEIAVIEGDVQ